MDRPTCKTCVYFQTGEVVAASGSCHKHAPKPILTGEENCTEWPMVHEDEWCGEHSGFATWMLTVTKGTRTP